jgi:cbb3-type cytochrome oxidase subunit 3
MMTNLFAFTLLLVAVVAYALLTAQNDDGRNDDE